MVRSVVGESPGYDCMHHVVALCTEAMIELYIKLLCSTVQLHLVFLVVCLFLTLMY